MWPPSSTARSDSPRSVHHWFPASSTSYSSGSPSSLEPSQSLACTHVGVQATRWAPFSSPVSSRSSRSSSTVRDGSSGMGAAYSGRSPLFKGGRVVLQMKWCRLRWSRIRPLRARERRAWPGDLLKRVGITLLVLAALWGALGGVPRDLDGDGLDAALRRQRPDDAADERHRQPPLGAACRRAAAARFATCWTRAPSRCARRSQASCSAR